MVQSFFVYLMLFVTGTVQASSPSGSHRPARRQCGTPSPSTPTPSPPPSNNGLNTVVVDGSRLSTARSAYKDGSASSELNDAVKGIVGDADGWLGKGPWSVTQKPKPAPNSTSIHDYYSMAPYFWPSKGKDGCPYIQKDGQRNPEIHNATDRDVWGNVALSVPSLTVAWYYTGEDKYAEHATKILRTWFIDEDTKMTPNLLHAQAIKCQNSGRYIGIIDFSQYLTAILDAVRILEFESASSWSAGDSSSFKQWSSDFYDWLTDSDFGKGETGTTNNHGVFADMQRAGLAMFLGKEEDAKDIAEGAKSKRIDAAIEGDGKQPQELARTKSYHYSTYALTAYTRLAMIGSKVGVDLWSYEGPKGQSIFKAVNYLLPAATGEEKWPHPELDFSKLEPLDVIHAAADAGLESAKKAFEDGKLTKKGSDGWYAWPSPEA